MRLQHEGIVTGARYYEKRSSHLTLFLGRYDAASWRNPSPHEYHVYGSPPPHIQFFIHGIYTLNTLRAQIDRPPKWDVCMGTGYVRSHTSSKLFAAGRRCLISRSKHHPTCPLLCV